MKKKFVIFLSSILLAVTSLFVPIFNRDKISAKAVTTSDTTSYVSVNEIWDSTNKVIKTNNLSLLFDYISGNKRTQYAQIVELAKDGLTAKDMRANSLTNSAGTVVKEANKDIIVTVGGLKWQVMYLSTNKDNEPILTLWLENSSALPNASITYHGYSSAAAYANPADVKYPSSMYGTSRARTEYLNAGGYKATSSSTVVYVEQNASNVFASFTMPVDGEYNDLTDFITTPENVEWQEFQRRSDGWNGSGQRDLSNEAWSNNLTSDKFSNRHYAKEDDNFAGKEYNDAWKSDYIWLPSFTEIGGASIEKGIWQPSENQKISNEAYLTRSVSDNQDWTSNSVNRIDANGTSVALYLGSTNSADVRPAFHLNLSSVFESIKQNSSENNNQTIYLDPIYGDNNENGKTILTAIKDIKLAEKMVEENGKVILLNTLTILEDTVLGANKTYTLQRYYSSSTDVFTGKMIVAGNYVSSGSADNVDVKLVLKAMIDSNRHGTYFLGGDVITINGNESSLVIEKNGGIKNHYGQKDTGPTYAIVLNQNSTFTMNDGEISNIYSYGNGGIIVSKGTGDITINGGTIKSSYVVLGGVLIYGTKGGKITINGGNITGLYSPNYTSIIFAENKDLIINDINFDTNYQGSGGGSPSGGLIRTKNITINGGYFANCYVQPRTESALNSPGMFNPTNSLTINGGYFENNTSIRSGAVIRLTSGTTATIKNTTFKDNESYIGGVIYAESANITIENCVFEGNKATKKITISSTDTYGGGVLYATGTTKINIFDCTFKNNTALDNGGCFSTTKDVTFTCKDSYFEGNSATEVTGTSAAMGGVGNHSALGQNLNNYYNCEFVGNNARSQAGAVTQANVYNCTFKNNRSGWNGGACYVVNAYNSDFINNSSYNGGGAISAAYRLEGCYFENNTTDNNYGGAVYIVQDVISCEFVDNKAAGAGGAIAHNASWFKYVNIDDCIFNGNYSDSYGGAIYLDNSTPETGYTGVTIENCTIEGNIAKTNGAGIYVAFYNDKLNVGKTYQSNYMFIDNNYIGTNFDSPTTKESNLYIHKGGDNFDGLKLLSNLEEGSVIDIESNITFTNELIAELSGVDAFVTDSTINAFTYKGVDYDFYSKTISSGNVKTGIGIYVKPVNGSGLVYTASDNYVEYDGLAHTINVNVISPTSDYGIVYSTDENGTYSTTPITVKEPGETAVVWFKIVSDSYGESSPESRVVTVEKLDIYLGSSLLAKTWIGEVFTKDVNIPVAVSGEIFDVYGNAVACDFIPSATKTIAKGDNNTEILVTVKPKNTQKYKSLTAVPVTIKISYDQLYFKDNAFAVDYEQTAKYKVQNSTVSIAEMVGFLENDAKIYFLSTYTVSNNISFETDKNITFIRYYVSKNNANNFKGSLFNVSSGKTLTIGSLTMAGSITFSGADFESNADQALISNAGKLYIYGNISFINSYNYSTSNNAGSIYNAGTLEIDGAYFFRSKTRKSGGAIFNSGTANIKNSFFRSCSAKDEGGAIFTSKTLYLDSCTFISSQGFIEADNDSNAPKGFCLSVNGNDATATIINSSIINSSTSSYTKGARYGGGLYIAEGATVIVKDSEISKNTAIRGGAVYITDASEITLINTKVEDNSLPTTGEPYGAAFYIETNAVVNFLSGSISGNYIAKNDTTARSIIYVKGTFNFGEYGSKNAVITANHHPQTGTNALVMRVCDGAKFNMYGGVIHNNYSCASTIYVNRTAEAYFYGGEFYNNNCAGTNAVINAYGEVYVYINNFYLGNSIGAGVDSQDTAKIHLVGDISNVNNGLTMKYISTTINGVNIVNGMILDLVATPDEMPTEDEWKTFASKITWYNGSTALTYGTHVVACYDIANNHYYIRVNQTITAKEVYFKPKTGSDTNTGLTKAQAVGTWDHVLTLNPTTVYLLETWELSGTVNINGNNIILKRHLDFTGNMIKVTTANSIVKISNLVVDGNADKDGTVNKFRDYLVANPAIYSEVGFSLNLENVTIKNNASKVSGAGIYIKADTSNVNYNLILKNTNVIKNAIIMDSSVGSSGRNFGAGIAIENYSQEAQNIKIDLKVNNCDISQNTIVSLTGGHENSSIQSYPRGGVGIGVYTNFTKDFVKNVSLDIRNSNFISNKTTGMKYNYGSAILFVNSSSNANTKNNEINFNINNCLFKDNGADLSNLAANNEVSVITAYCLKAGTVNFNVTDSDFIDNTSYTNVYVYANKDGSSINFERCVFSTKTKYSEGYRTYVYTTGANTKVTMKSCEVSGVKNVTRYGFCFSNTLSTATDNYNVIVEDCDLYNINNNIVASRTNLTVKNCKIHDAATSTGYGLETNYSTVLVENCDFYRNYGGVNFSTSTTATVKNTFIRESSYYGVSVASNNIIVFENVEIFNCTNCSMNLNTGVTIKGINSKIYNASSYAINISSSQSTETNISGFDIYNVANYGIYCSSGHSIGTVNISDMNISNIYYSGIYFNLGSGQLNSSQNYTTVVNISNCVIKNCNEYNYISSSTVYAGIHIYSYAYYNESNPTTTTKTVNIKNTKLIDNLVGFSGYYGGTSSPYVVTQINFDSNCEISGSRYGIYDYKSTAVKTHVYSGSPKIINNSYAGIYSYNNNSAYRVDLSFTNAVINNNPIDIYYPKVYIEGTNNDIGKIYCYPETATSGITLTNTTSFKNVVKIILYQTSTIVADMKMVEATYEASSAEMETYLTKFNLFGWDLKISGKVILTKEEVGTEGLVNVYYLDCQNTTGRATDINFSIAGIGIIVQKGTNPTYPVKTFKYLWENCIDHTKKSIVYLYSYMTITENKVYDFANVTFVPYTKPSTGEPYFSPTYYISLNSSMTIKNLTFDGKDFEESQKVRYLLNSTNSSYNITIDNLTIKNFVFTNSYALYFQNLNSFTMTNSHFENCYAGSSILYLYQLKATNISNCEFYNCSQYSIYINSPSAETIIKDCTFTDCYYGVYGSIQKNYKVKIENCDFVNTNNYGIYLNYPYSTEIVGCDFSENNTDIYISNIYDSTETKITNCVFEKAFNQSIYIDGNYSNNQPVYIEGCTILNTRNYGLYVTELKTIQVKNVEILNCSYGIYHGSKDINLNLQNVEILNCKYGIYSVNAQCTLTLDGYIEGSYIGVYAGRLLLVKGTIQNNDIGLQNTGSSTLRGGFIQNNRIGIVNTSTLNIEGGIISNNIELAIENPSEYGTLNIKGGIIDNTNGVKQVMLSSGKIVSYSIYCAGTIKLSENPIVTAPILTTTFDKSRVLDFSKTEDIIFTVENNTKYSQQEFLNNRYEWYEDGEGLKAGNKGQNSSAAEITFTAVKATSITYTYYIESESPDKLYIYKNNTSTPLVNGFSGTGKTVQTRTDSLVAGDKLIFYYRKDVSVHTGIDTPIITGIHISGGGTASLSTKNNIESADKPYYANPTTNTYTFVERNDGAMVNNNNRGSTGTASYSIVATKDFTLSFDYSLYCYTNNYLQIKVNGTEDKKVNGVSNTVVTGSYSKNLSAGDSVEFIYYKSSTYYTDSVVITGFDYVEPIMTPTIVVGDLGAQAIVNFAVPSNAVVGDAIASYNGTLTTAKIDETIKHIKVNGYTVSRDITGDKYSIILSAQNDAAKEDNRDISNYIFFDPNNTALDDTNDGRTPQTAVKTWARVLEIAQESGCDKVFAMSVWQITADTVIEGHGLTLYRYYLSSSARYNTGIVIQVKNGKKLTINNLNFNGNYKLNGVEVLKATQRFFDVEANATLTINNSIVENCAYSVAQKTTSVLYNLGSVVFNNVIMRDNHSLHNSSTTTEGGIIFSKGNLEINDSIFEYNRNTTASQHNSKVGGGVICMYGNGLTTEITLKVTNSIFNNNYAHHDTHANYGGRGGAIYANTKTNVLIYNCEFNNNYSNQGGGALGLYNCVNIEIKDCIFENNYTNASADSCYGTAVDIQTATSAKVDNCYFYRNGIKGSGRGTLSVREVKTLTLTNTEFNYNLGYGTGSSFYINNSTIANSEVTVDNVYVHHNYQTVNNYSGAMSYLNLNATGKATVTNSRFSDHSNKQNAYLYSMFYFIAGNLTLDNLDFKNNVNRRDYDLSFSMVAVGVRTGTNTSISNINVCNNLSIDGYMFIIYNSGTTTAQTDMNINVKNVLLADNYCGSVFGVYTAIAGSNNKVSMKNVVINDNMKLGDFAHDGIAMSIKYMVLDLENVTVVNQHYTEGKPWSTVSLTNCEGVVDGLYLKDNVQYWAALRVAGSAEETLTFKNLKVLDNTARSSVTSSDTSGWYTAGGMLVGNMQKVTIENSEISGNSIISGFGSGFVSFNSNVVLKNTNISNNKFIPANKDSNQATTIPDRVFVTDTGFDPYYFATTSGTLKDLIGGAGVGVYGGSLEVVGGEITKNVSNGLGGGLLVFAPLKIDGTKIYDNKAISGAGVLATMDAIVNNAQIYDNDAQEVGGGIWFAAGLTVNNSNIHNNYAEVSGAGIYSNSEKASLIIENTLINENTTAGDGAAVYFANPVGELKVNNSKFIGNRAAGLGTAIYSKTEPNITNTELTGNYIEGNSLIHFGAVYATVLNGVTISGNYGKGDNATLFSFDTPSIALPRFDISNSKIYGNTNDKLALIVIDKNIYFSINDSEVHGNTNKNADGKGGLINIKSGTLKFENGTLKNNYAVNGGSLYFSTGSSGLLINTLITGHTNTSSNNYCINGSVYIENGAEVKFIGGEVTANDLAKSNGVIYNAGSLSFKETAIHDNTIKNGAVYNDSTGLISLEDIGFHKNTAVNGGAIYNKGTVNFVSGEILGNKAVNESQAVLGSGGAIYNAEGGLFSISGGSIYFNLSENNGGAVYNQGSLTFNDGEIYGNTMKFYGGGIYNGEKGKLIINGGLISNNGPSSGSTGVAGLGIANFGEMYMYDGEIIDNYIEKTSQSFNSSKGAAIYSGINSYTAVLGGYIDNNVTQNGSGIYADTYSVVDVRNVTIDNTSRRANTTAYGRAIYANNAQVTLTNTTIKCGNAMGSNNDNLGSVTAINSTLTINSSVFMYNKDNKGVVSCNGGSLVVYDTLFENNRTEFAATSSGILYLENLKNLTITYSDFVNNGTKSNGGAIALVLNEEFNGIIENCLFENNNAGESGGAIYITAVETENSDSMLTIKNSTFIGNYAEVSGGAIALANGNGIEVVIEDSIFGGVKDKNGNQTIEPEEILSNVTGGDGGAIAYLPSETAMSLTLKGNNEITYNKATGFGGGIYYDYAYAANTASNYYGLKIESSSMPIITNNTHGSNVTSNLYILNTADRNILTTGLKKDSLVGLTLVSTNAEVIGVDSVIVKGRDASAPITTNDRVAFVYDDTKYLLRLDSTLNALVLTANENKFMKAVANDVIHAVDGKFKSVTAEDIQVIGVTDYTVTFASAEDGNYTAEGPKYTTKGTYVVWYKVVDNTGKNDPIIGSVKLKLTGKILLLENRPTAYLNKGETLSLATFKNGLVLSDGSAVSGKWEFENGTITPTNTTQKYKVIFKPNNQYIYENEVSTFVTINISYNRVFYVEDGFYVDKEGTKPTGIKLLSEMVSCMEDLGSIFFVTTYVVGSSGVISEDVYTDKQIYFGVTPLLGNNNMISLPSGTPVKLTLGGGAGKIIIDGRAGYSVYNILAPLFNNRGILTLKSNVKIEQFYNTEGGTSVVENHGTLYLNGCTMYNNRSNSETALCKGGAIYNTGDVYINGGDYRYNRTHNSSNANGLGGFMYNEGGSVVINGGNFGRNMATNGGFIYSDDGLITVNGGNIYGCHAYEYGGAIYLTNMAQLTINGGSIMLNHAGKEGAGVFVDNCVVYVNGGVVKYNTVTSSIGFDVPGDNKEKQTDSLNWVVELLTVLTVAAMFVVVSLILKPKNKKFKTKIKK